MDDVPRMGRHQPVCDPCADPHQVIGLHLLGPHELVEARPVDEVHHQIDVVVGGAKDAGILNDGGMPDLPDLFLAFQEFEVIVVLGELGREHLDGEDTSADLVFRLVDFGGAAPPEDALDAERVVQEIAGLERVALSGF